MSSETTQSHAGTSAPPPPAIDNDFKYYLAPGAAASPHNLPELPDSYFEPTAADLRVQQASLSARTDALVNAPLRTQAMRDAEKKAKLARFPTTTIRVKFPDRSQLEKAFPSSDKIRAVYAFVRGSLRDDVKPTKFVLYQTPPKREYKVSDPNVRDLSLLELQFAPSSVLLLRFEKEELNHPNVPAPLLSEILARAIELPAPPNYDAESSAAKKERPKVSGTPGEPTTASKPPPSGSSSKEQKIAKFLKLGGKK